MKSQQKLWIDLEGLRIEQALPQQESARRLGISRSHLSELETGKRRIPMNMMQPIINVFNVTEEDFLIYTMPGY